MNIQLIRKYFKPDYTIGKLYIDGTYYCDTLELPNPIQTGTYNIEIQYSPKFKKSMPYLMNVPDQRWIMLHAGNTVADTLGCILVGRNTSIGQLTESKTTSNNLFEKISLAISNTDKVSITIIKG